MSNNQNGQQSNNSSKLNLTNSEQFRGFLLSKNLRPYSQLGNSGVDNSTRYFETVLSNLVPKRTESLLDIGKEYYEKLTSNNPFGKIEKIDSAEAINTLDGPVSVDQIGNGKTEEYTSANSKLELVNDFFIDVAAIVNRYKPEGGFKESYLSSDNIVPKYVGSSQMYPNYSIIQKNITSFAQKDGTLNKYIPLEGYIGPYTLEDNLPNLEGGDIGSYPNFSKINNRNWIEYQKVIASINQYIPENGYVNEISLNVNVKPKNSEKGNEYRSSTLSEKDILEKIKEESIINRYQPKNGLFNAYSNRLVSLPKLSNGTDEYTNQSNNLDNYTYANQTAAAAINKFIPQNGYNEEVFLKLNSLIKTNKDIGGYSSSSRSNEDIIKKVKDEVTINRYQPENGMYNIYENSIYTLNKLRGGSKAYSNSSEILKQNSTNPQKEAASINKFKPIGGYSNEISMGLYTLPVGSGRFDEYIASALEDEEIIKKTKESTLVNKYQPFGGEYNKYTYVFNTLSKPNGGSSEYTSSSNIIGELSIENQIFALTSNKYAPQAGSNLPINVNSISLINESERQTEYPSNLRPINEIPQKVLSDVSLNRYMALEGNLNSYSNRTTILPKITNGAQEYTNSDLFSLMINKKSRDESASINKFRPIDGYNYEISFSIQTIKNGDNINSEYFASTKDEQDFLKNTSEETRLNRYQPQQGLFSLYSINLNSLTKLEGGSQEYNIDNNSLIIFNKLNQTEAGLTNKYAPQNGFINFAEINTFVVPRGDYAQVEYPNNLKPNLELEKEKKIGLSLNRYIANNGQLDFDSQTIKIIQKVNSGAEH